MTSVGSTSLSYDGRGNMTYDGSKTFGYDSRNQLTVPATGATLRYDALGRLYELDSGGNPSRYYDVVEGNELTHMSSASAIQRRHVFLPGETSPILWYDGANTANRRYLHADERGSITAMVTQAGTPLVAPSTYDEYGRISGPTGFFGYTGQETFNFADFYKSRYYSPGLGRFNMGGDTGAYGTPTRYGDFGEAQGGGRFQYTGQYWIVEPNILYYKNRFYDPKLGRFLQTDPTGYGAGMNMYGYVGGDPINFVDPLGLLGIVIEHCRLGTHRDKRTGGCVADGKNFTLSAPTDHAGQDDQGSSGAMSDVPCEPSPNDVYDSADTATVAAARATALRNNQNNSSAALQEFHAAVRAVSGGFSFSINAQGDPSGGTTRILLYASSFGSAHNHESGDSYDAKAAFLSGPTTNSIGHITLVNDINSYRSFFSQASARNPGIRDQLNIAISGPNGRLYYWPPGSNLNSAGKDVGATFCK